MEKIYKNTRQHNHNICDHQFEFCRQCNEVWCINCQNYWVKKDLKPSLTISAQTPYGADRY